MKIRIWLRFLHPVRRLLVGLVLLCQTLTLRGAFQPEPRGDELDLAFFFVQAIPMTAGIIFCWAFQDAACASCTFAIPGLRSRLRTAYLIGAGLVSALPAAATHSWYPEFPVAPLIATASAVCLVSAPFGPGTTWAGSVPAAYAVLLGLAGVLGYSQGVFDAIRERPVLVTVIGAFIAGGSVATAFSRTHIRRLVERARDRLWGNFALWNPTRMKERRETAARHFGRKARWTASLLDASPLRLVRALHFERFGTSFLGTHSALALSLLVFAAGFLLLENLSGHSIAERMLSAFAPDGDQRMGFRVLGLFVFGLSGTTGLQRFSWLYPVSRARLARSAYASFGLNLLAVTAEVAIAGIFLVLYLAWHSGRSVNPAALAAAVFQLGWGVAFGPLVQWSRLNMQVTNAPLPILVVTATIISVGPGMFYGLGFLSPAVSTALCLSLIASGQAALFLALRRFYTRGDFVRRPGGKLKFGLV